jgi:cyclic beta-1,2-glucan synthetase
MCILALVLGWTLPLNASMAWTAFILATIALPALLPLTSIFVPPRSGMSWQGHWRAAASDLAFAVVRIAFTLTFLAHQAWMMIDAIARTSWRLLITHRRMLDWVTAAQAGFVPRPDVARTFTQMAGAVIIGVSALVMSAIFSPQTAPLALPFAALWILSPLVARWSSKSPMTADSVEVSRDAAIQFRGIARQTWRFFETFVTDTDNSLPPDNYQEAPEPVVANRTSPTNIGLYLLSTIAARDLGWIGTADMTARIEATFSTLSKLELYRGHLLNWYDTRSLLPLEPRYISSVDSGNLAGHLIAVANACTDRTASLLAGDELVTGLQDALALAHASLDHTIDQSEHPVSDLITRLHAYLCSLAAGRLSDLQLAQATSLTNELVTAATVYAAARNNTAAADTLYWCQAAGNTLDSHARDTLAREGLEHRLQDLAGRAHAIANDMDFRFLMNEDTKLLSIGYVVSTGTLDSGCYDLLASEARLASFVAMAKGDAPATHWFHLGRLLTPVKGGAALVSWSGSMFEYLMPSLVMRAPEGSLLATSNRAVVARQIDYAHQFAKPWGVSESAYNTRDLNYTYQYSNFGVPGLGLKRGLSDNFVVAPYATALAAMVDPGAASLNFHRLDTLHARGRYGYCEAIDFTSGRVPKGEQRAIIGAWMAHHQGMTIVALANVLSDGRMRTRFHSEPRIRAIDLLLQERMPREVALARPRAEEVHTSPKLAELQGSTRARVISPHATPPATLLMSNGRYTSMLTAAGGGFSRWGNLAITRWREDQTCDDFGSHIYVRADRNADVWSAGFQPRGTEPNEYRVDFQSGRGEISRRDGKFTTTMDVITSPEVDGEVRRVSITNHDTREHEVEVTYYAELVLAPASADWAHLAFSKLFVQTDYITDRCLLLANRRRRSPEEADIWVGMHAVTEGECLGGPQIETDRMRFLGRGRTPRNPTALSDTSPLSNTVGAVLDPCFAHRQRMRIPAGSTIRIAYWTWAAESRDGVMTLAEKHRTPNAYERVSTLAWSQAQIERHHLGISLSQVDSYQRLASHMLGRGSQLRAPQRTIERGLQPASALWAHGISGDRPIMLVRIEEEEDLKFVADVLRAHEYWQRKTLFVDLVILNDKTASYVQELQASLQSLVRISEARRQQHPDGTEGKIFILRRTDMTPEARLALQAAARIELVTRRGTLMEQLDRLETLPVKRQSPEPRETMKARTAPQTYAHGRDLEYFNSLGGFGSNGREYVIDLKPGQHTPAPWINVVSNEHFGFQVSGDGGGFTWSGSSRENQLTEWVNDPVTDRPPEVLYIRDNDTAEVWSATPSPIRLPGTSYLVRHGQGYSRFEHATDGLAVYMLQYAAAQDPVKITRLTIRNTSRHVRNLTVTSYVEWLMAPPKGLKASPVVTSQDPVSHALFARSPASGSYATQVAFSDMAGQHAGWTCDRTEFLGRNGTIANPAALAPKTTLSGHAGAGLDACAALQRTVVLRPGASVEVVVLLGVAPDEASARVLISRYRDADLDRTLDEVTEFWDRTLEKIQVRTPDRSMDIMLNRWLLYQTIACRLWARSAFYQSGGAYGFRDQLQDAMALTTALPSLTREHLLRAASRQFLEGDVQHWWLAETGMGIRTGFADDRIWLAFATAHYVNTTGDVAVLEEQIPFLVAPKLQPGQSDAYGAADTSAECATLFEHCALALDSSLSVGVHGLPLIGSGDWNDGFNHIGRNGKGESIWMGWFLFSALKAFAPLASARNDQKRVKDWQLHGELLQSALERDGWDGDWYRRAYFDDGTPLGSGTNANCRIDSIAQSWAVLSGAADPDRARRAMDAVDTLLIDRSNGVAMLFTPPFDNAPVDPGYVAGYPPGIRENGGQYTHAAVWSAMAFAALGRGDKAANLFWSLNPINRSRTQVDAERYRVEPYAVAADVYSVPPHVGRGGWTWYTGAAGWLYRAGLESILGFRLQGNLLHLDPCIPSSWPGFEITYRHGDSVFEISVQNPRNVNRGVTHASLDDVRLPDPSRPITLVDDGKPHVISIVLG